MASTNGEASKAEIKQQGIIETAQAAAQDPQSSISPETVENQLVKESLNVGVPAFQFDPAAPPEKKAEAAKLVSREICPNNCPVSPLSGNSLLISSQSHHHSLRGQLNPLKKAAGVAVASDMVSGKPLVALTDPIVADVSLSQDTKDAKPHDTYDLPSTSKATDHVAPPPTKAEEKQAAEANGQLTEEMRWARDRTGWAPRFEQKQEDVEDAETLLDHRTLLEGKLDDKFFGGRCCLR
jgi:hypothetical protein